VLATAIHTYAADNRGALPESQEVLVVRLVPKYLATIPTIGPDVLRVKSYTYIPLGNLGDVRNPGDAIMLFEAPGMWKRAGGNLVYANGTVKFIDGLKYDGIVEKAEGAMAKPALPK